MSERIGVACHFLAKLRTGIAMMAFAAIIISRW